MESLLRLREPVAWAAIIVLAVRVLNAVATAAVYAGQDGAGGVPSAATLISYRAGDSALAAVLTLVLLTCVLTNPTPHARTLTTIALVVVGVSFLVALAFAVVALASPSDTFVLDTVDLLANQAVPVLALITLVKLLSVTSPGRQPAQLTDGPAGGDQRALPPAPDPRYQPTWQPDQAAGAAWQTAGDAAAGAPASGWGTPGQQGGWQYPPGPGAQPPPGSQPSQPTRPQPPGGEQPPWLGGSQS